MPSSSSKDTRSGAGDSAPAVLLLLEPAPVRPSAAASAANALCAAFRCRAALTCPHRLRKRRHPGATHDATLAPVKVTRVTPTGTASCRQRWHHTDGRQRSWPGRWPAASAGETCAEPPQRRKCTSAAWAYADNRNCATTPRGRGPSTSQGSTSSLASYGLTPTGQRHA